MYFLEQNVHNFCAQFYAPHFCIGNTISCDMPKIKLVLDKRRKKKSGAYPLVIRIRQDNKFIDVATNYELHPHQFDDKTELVVGDKALNKHLRGEIAKCKDKLDSLEKLIEEVSIEDIRALFLKHKKVTPATIDEFWLEEAQKLVEIGKTGNARVYLTALNGLKLVMSLHIPFQDLNHKHLLDAELKLLKKGVKMNTVSVYMRTLRAICNKAIFIDLVDQSWYPFFKYKIKKGKTLPKTLNIDEMKRYFALNLHNHHPLYKSYTIGKLMFLLRGINYKDLVKLTQQNIINKRIVYERSKTKTVYSIGLEVEIENLLEKLANRNLNLTGVMEKEFHLIDQDIEVLKRYNQYLHLFNNHLKRIGKLLELETKLSSYVMRYSYANIARSLGFSVEEISYLLGHKSSSHAVTEIYLEQFDSQKLDTINRKIINAVTGR